MGVCLGVVNLVLLVVSSSSGPLYLGVDELGVVNVDVSVDNLVEAVESVSSPGFFKRQPSKGIF